jgi:hypothetical protein
VAGIGNPNHALRVLSAIFLKGAPNPLPFRFTDIGEGDTKKLHSDFGNWIQDGLRHSFGTYYHNLRRDIPEVVYVMGNSVGIAKKHYRRGVTKEWNDKVWSLKPAP